MADKVIITDMTIQPDDYFQIAAQALNAPKVIKINKRFVQQATSQQLGMAVAQGLAQGVKETAMTNNLAKQGVDRNQAAGLVYNIKQALENYKNTPAGRKLMAHKYRNQMIVGFVLAVIGAVITIVTFMAAASSEYGGTYLIAYGPVIWGVISFFVGLNGWLKYREK